jgi:proline dehydrogenase
MISFENTEIAFKSKSDKDLNRAYWLFRIIGNPSMVKFGKKVTPLALNLNLPIQGVIKKTIFQQFCGGETINECAQAIKHLDSFGIGTILDYSIEGKTAEEDFDQTVKEIIDTIRAGKDNPAIPFAVFKVTGITTFSILEKANTDENSLTTDELRQFNRCKERVEEICQAAYDHQVPVFIDAEESWIQDAIDRITIDMMRKFNKERAIVYNTLQMYRHDRLEFLKNETQIAQRENFFYGIKLVRGAYMEKERKRAAENNYTSPIQPDKSAADRDFDLAVEFILDHISCLALCAGTHNENSSLNLATLMKTKGLDPQDKRVYFAQLLGMSDHISYNLSHAGYNVAKYVPYGPIKEVMPYLLRRADENTSVAGQTSRELSLIIKEKSRRKLAK